MESKNSPYFDSSQDTRRHTRQLRQSYAQSAEKGRVVNGEWEHLDDETWTWLDETLEGIRQGIADMQAGRILSLNEPGKRQERNMAYRISLPPRLREEELPGCFVWLCSILLLSVTGIPTSAPASRR